MKQKIVFFGSSKYVIPVIQTLKSANSRLNLELVVTTEQNPNDAVPSFSIKNNIPYLSVSRLSHPIVNNKLSIVNAELAVLADFGLIIPKEVLNLFPKGIVNLHPSLLPKYRGPSPVQNAILNGDKKTGNSIIILDEKVDHGPVLFQKEEKISENDTAESLYLRLFKIGADNLIEVINEYTNGKLKPVPQDHAKASFTKILSRKDGFIDIGNCPPAEKIKQMIRAYFPWPGVYFKTDLNGNEKIIKLLPKGKVQVEGKNPMSYKDFENGYSEGKNLLRKIGLIPN
ncbi:MAG: methionyl-tRNA formyltransferase [Patescibacteria group bacterium]